MSEFTVPSISPFLFCADLDASLEFLVKAFGLEAGTVHRDGDGAAMHASAGLDGQLVFLSPEHQLENLRAAKALSGRHSLVMVYVPDVDAVYERARAAGATVGYEIEDMPYGQRECGLEDLDGNLWSFATLLPS